MERARDYIWEGGEKDGEGKAVMQKLVLVGHSMAGLNMRVFQDRNRELVHGIVFADPVNPDFIEGPGFGNRFPPNPLYVAGSWVLAPSGLWPIVLKIIGAPIGKEATDNPIPPEYPDLIPRYASIISKSSWFDTANHEW
jgi:pimeloyl-ACP methyl ester carboxylesterase